MISKSFRTSVVIQFKVCNSYLQVRECRRNRWGYLLGRVSFLPGWGIPRALGWKRRGLYQETAEPQEREIHRPLH